MQNFTLISSVCLVFSVITSSAVVLDLRNLPVSGSGYDLTAQGITVSFGANGGILTSNSYGFGIDSTSNDDIPNLLDGGSGRAEVISFLFNQDVYVDSILISLFGPGDAGTISIKGTPPAVQLHNGLNDLGGLRTGGTSANFIRWTGPNTSDPDLGFSIDAITVRPIPEPSSLLLGMTGAILLLRRRRSAL